MPATPKKPQAWLWTLVAFAVLSQTSLNMARPQMSYKLIELGADASLIGVMTALYAVLPLFLALWLGRAMERIHNLRYVVLIGGVFIGLGAAVMALFNSITGIALASTMLGFGHLVFVIGSQASIPRYSTDSGLDKGFGWQTAGISAGQLIGPLLGGFLLGNSSGEDRMHLINLSLWVGAGFALISVPLMLWPVRLKEMPALTSEIPITTQISTQQPGTDANKKKTGQKKDPSGKPTTFKILQQPGIKPTMLVSLAMLSVMDILISFLPLVGERMGVSPFWVGVLLAVRSGTSTISRFMLPALGRRWNRSQLVITSLLVSAVLIALVPFILNTMWLALIAMAVAGFFVGITQPLTMTMVVKQVPTSWRSPALAVRLMGNRLGQVVIPLVSGLVAAPLGPAGAIWFTCILIAVSGVERGIAYAKTGPTEADR